MDPTPDLVRAALAAASDAPGYPTTAGTAELRAAAVDWFTRRRGVVGLTADAVLPTIGSKELVAWLPTLLGLGPGLRVTTLLRVAALLGVTALLRALLRVTALVRLAPLLRLAVRVVLRWPFASAATWVRHGVPPGMLIAVRVLAVSTVIAPAIPSTAPPRLTTGPIRLIPTSAAPLPPWTAASAATVPTIVSKSRAKHAANR